MTIVLQALAITEKKGESRHQILKISWSEQPFFFFIQCTIQVFFSGGKEKK